jgi:hypothetical protein
MYIHGRNMRNRHRFDFPKIDNELNCLEKTVALSLNCEENRFDWMLVVKKRLFREFGGKRIQKKYQNRIRPFVVFQRISAGIVVFNYDFTNFIKKCMCRYGQTFLNV